jgi:nicotinate-nucleotide--dimethylbenzimidazole phosphoribosyltransferase
VFNDRARGAALRYQNELTKPRGSLGRLEDIAAWYCGATGQFPCEPPDVACLAVFAADHGVVVEGISAYGSQVTADMVCNMMAGGAAVNVLARHHRVRLALVDVGVAGDLSAAPVRPRVELTHACVRAGTRNLRREPAMTRSEVQRAMNVGKLALNEFAEGGARIVAVGEIGIGNTTAGAALVCAMTGAAPLKVVGRGTGIDDATHERKIQVVQDALRLHAPDRRDPIGVLAAVGGLELAAMVGFLLQAAERRVPIVLDGFLAVASALVARALLSQVVRFMIASHDSAEHGSRLALDALELVPLLSLQMRLGEGTGAVLGVELVRSAVALQNEMATFATAGVVRDGADGRNP